MRPAPVSVLLTEPHTPEAVSDTSVPKDVRVRDALFQTALAIVVLATVVAPTLNDLSTFTKSPVGTLPQDINADHTPSVAPESTA